MPELPEVEIARRNLARWGAGRVVDAVDLVDPGVVRTHLSTRPSDQHPDGARVVQALLVGRVLGEPARMGKRIGLPSVHPAGLLCHLGMTGRWIRASTAPGHTRLGLVLAGVSLWFVDPRRFGCVVPTEHLEEALGHGLGPDALAVDAAVLAHRLRGRRAVKVALMDQAVVAGLGNIHAAEALWRAGVHPATPCDRLDDHPRLVSAIREQLRLSLERDDGPELAYLTEGRSPNPFEVYGRAGEPCARCGDAVASSRLGGRATYWCPGCQPRT